MTHPTPREPTAFAPRRLIPLQAWERFGTVLVNVLVFGLLVIYLFPMVYMVAASLMDSRQLGDRYAPPYPARPVTFAYGGKDLKLYQAALSTFSCCARTSGASPRK
jgi:ABC-type glycerol-3-phosphate transport system permease component